MNTKKAIVSMWAREGTYGGLKTEYVSSCVDMSDYGYINVGTVEVDIECIEPDFKAIKELMEEKQELMDRHQEEVKEINERMKSGAA